MRNDFDRYGVDPAEFGGALAEALCRGGADEEEIREAVTGAHVDEAMPDDAPPWRLTRNQQHHAN